MGVDPNYKKPFEEIRAEMAAAAKAIPIGSIYDHYKGMGRYKVVMFAIREEDNELCVVYERVDQPDMHFTRPVKEWLQTVDWDGRSLTRFQLVV